MSSWHYEQSYPNSCVPACACMVQRWLGLPPTEDLFHAGAHPKGHDLGMVEHWLSGVCRIRRENDEQELQVALLTDAVLIVVLVCGPAYVYWQSQAYPELQSKHKQLCAPGSFGPPFHAVVLIERQTDGFLLLDPYYPGETQPLFLPDDAFDRCFAGGAYVIEK